MSTNNFRTLDLAVEFYKTVEKTKFPNHLRDQVLRASSSISLNLAEGNAKYSRKDKARIYQIALGSLRECQAIFRLAEISDVGLLKTTDQLGAYIYKLVRSVSPSDTENRTPY